MAAAPKIALAIDRRAARIASGLMRRLAPAPVVTLPQWAEKYRRLSPESSTEPGRWDNTRAAYQVGMMAALSDPRIERVVLMTSARVGKTQACINNLVGMHMHLDPCNIMLVLPTEQRADEWADDEFSPMCRDTPALRDILGFRKSRVAKDRRKHREFPGGRLYVVGANAPSGLAAKTIRVLCCDEIDRFPASAGGEGDPISLAIRRTATAWNRKIVLSSTPTIEGASRIQAAFAESDQRRFWVPCPHCEAMQVLQWESVVWDGDDASTALYHCNGCGAGWNDAQRWAAVRRGEWRADEPFNGIAGFHINELASPWRKLSETVNDFLAAKSSPDRLQTWKNLALGLTWQEQGEAPDWERIVERREPYPMGVVPAGAVVLTAGVDVQRDRLEADIWAWGPGLESWLVDSRSLPGDPTERPVWDALAALLDTNWPHEGGGALRIEKIGVDTGGTDTQATYAALRRAHDPRLMPLKGIEGWNKASPVNGPTLVDVTEGGRKLRRGLKLWTVAVSTLKSGLYGRLRLTRGDGLGFPPGWVHLPEGLEAEGVRQLVAEQLVTVKDKRGYARMEWRKLRDRNERLDCAVYARAALTLLGVDRYGDRFWGRYSRVAEATPDEAPALPMSPLTTQAPAAPRAPAGRARTDFASLARRMAGRLA